MHIEDFQLKDLIFSDCFSQLSHFQVSYPLMILDSLKNGFGSISVPNEGFNWSIRVLFFWRSYKTNSNYLRSQIFAAWYAMGWLQTGKSFGLEFLILGILEPLSLQLKVEWENVQKQPQKR